MQEEVEATVAGAGNPSIVDRRTLLAGSGVAALGLAMPGAVLAQASAAAGPRRPRFAKGVQPFKWTNMPAGKVMGNIPSVTVSPVNGDIYFLQSHEAATSPVPMDRQYAGAIVRLDKNGRYINSFGNKADAPVIDGDSQWMGTPDNLEVDADGNVWVSPDLRTGVDNATLCYTPEGKFLKQFGVRNKPSTDRHDNKYFKHPASVYLDKKTNTWFIADGYGTNYRIVSIDGRTGQMNRIWGAYGKDPDYFDYNAPRRGATASLGSAGPDPAWGITKDPPKNDGFGIPIHKVILAPDGKLLAADRSRSRVQEFEILPNGVRYIRQVHVAGGTDSYGTASDIAVTPDNKWLYVTSMRDSRIYIVDRASFKVVSWMSVFPDDEGFDNGPVNLRPFHRFALLANGDILCARCVNDIVVKKFIGVY